MRKQDPVVDWYSRLPPSDQMLLAIILRRRGHPQVASVLDRLRLEKDVAWDWAAAVLTGLWRSAAGAVPGMGERVSSDLRGLSERGQDVFHLIQDKLGETLDYLGSAGHAGRLNGAHPDTQKGVVQMAREDCWRQDGFGNWQRIPQGFIAWRDTFPEGVSPPPKRQ